jgi:hypothetical protein
MSNFTHFGLVLDVVNLAYLALSKSAVKPTSHNLTLLATSYSSASIGGSENNPLQLPLHKIPTRLLSNYLCHLATLSCRDPAFLFV